MSCLLALKYNLDSLLGLLLICKWNQPPYKYGENQQFPGVPAISLNMWPQRSRIDIHIANAAQQVWTSNGLLFISFAALFYMRIERNSCTNMSPKGSQDKYRLPMRDHRHIPAIYGRALDGSACLRPCQSLNDQMISKSIYQFSI